MTLLFFAFQEALNRNPQQLSIMGELVKAGADLNHEVPNFGSVLRVVLNSPPPEFLQALLDAGIDPNATTPGKTPIIFFVTSKRTFKSLELLIARNADVNKRDSLRNTALYEALTGFDFDAIDYLLDHGANPNTWNVNGVSFAAQLQAQMNRQVEGAPFWLKLVEIRDRIIKMGVKWPPESPEQVRARWGDKEGWVDDSKHPLQ
jgi:ankyrin repeat protein